MGWLLKCCTSKHVEANVIGSFLTDKINNIMDIEPAILLMVHSIPKYINNYKNPFLFSSCGT